VTEAALGPSVSLKGERLVARVKRTAGLFLLLAIALLLGTVAGSMKVVRPDVSVDPPLQVQAAVDVSSVHASGVVDILTGVRNLVPAVPFGKVAEICVHEYEAVKAGQPLVKLDDTQARNSLKEAEQALAKSKAALQDAKDKAQKQIAEHEFKVIQAKGALETAQAQLRAAEKQLEHAKKYANDTVQGELQRLQAESNFDLARKAVETGEAALRKLQSIDPQIKLTEFDEAIKEAELKLRSAQEALEAYIIRAPVDGHVFDINYQVGGPAPLPPTDGNSSRALVFCPEGELIVRAEIDEENALLVRPGMKAVITRQTATGKITLSGRVERVASYMQRRRSSTLDPATYSDSRTRECIIRLDPDSKATLLINMRVAVRIDRGREQ
jgi:multidrug resistance efflux pump